MAIDLDIDEQKANDLIKANSDIFQPVGKELEIVSFRSRIGELMLDARVDALVKLAGWEPEMAEEKCVAYLAGKSEEEITERVYLSYDEAVAMLPDGDEIHTFVNPTGGMMVGADWSRESVLELFKTGLPEIAGEMATSMGHGIVAWRKVIDGDKRFDPIFIATKEAGDGSDS